MTPHKHYPRTWTATHSNGWETWVAETEQREFVVWICPAGAQAPVDRIARDLKHAQAGALSALRTKTHHLCSGTCSAWEFAKHDSEEDCEWSGGQ